MFKWSSNKCFFPPNYHHIIHKTSYFSHPISELPHPFFPVLPFGISHSRFPGNFTPFPTGTDTEETPRRIENIRKSTLPASIFAFPGTM